MTSSQDSTSGTENLTARMTKTLLGLAGSLVDHPASLRVEVNETDGGLTLRLFVISEDFGKVIGKQGRTARALRTLLSAIASKDRQRLTLDVVEEA